VENERFALKILRQDLRNDKEEVGFLRHEFEVGKSLKHPNIIRIYEFNTEGNAPYLVLELYSEQNLKQGLRAGHEAWAFYVPRIVEQAANALYVLHSAGWVHCDVKPDNYLVSETGDVKLIDFTIAERIKKFSFFSRKRVRGTRSYMSPEQIRGKPLDPRADVYSFGCVLYELLSGKLPYTGNTPDELLERHLHAQVPSVQAANNNVTDEAADLVKRMMAKKPGDRPADMYEFLKEFQKLRLFKKAPRRPDAPREAESSSE